jgi:hypothetical protein
VTWVICFTRRGVGDSEATKVLAIVDFEDFEMIGTYSDV